MDKAAWEAACMIARREIHLAALPDSENTELLALRRNAEQMLETARHAENDPEVAFLLPAARSYEARLGERRGIIYRSLCAQLRDTALGIGPLPNKDTSQPLSASDECRYLVLALDASEYAEVIESVTRLLDGVVRWMFRMNGFAKGSAERKEFVRRGPLQIFYEEFRKAAVLHWGFRLEESDPFPSRAEAESEFRAALDSEDGRRFAFALVRILPLMIEDLVDIDLPDLPKTPEGTPSRPQ